MPVPADSDAERHVLGVSGEQDRGDVRDRQAPYPAERTLIVSGMLESCLTSKLQGGKRLETPRIERALSGAEEEPARPVVGGSRTDVSSLVDMIFNPYGPGTIM